MSWWIKNSDIWVVFSVLFQNDFKLLSKNINSQEMNPTLIIIINDDHKNPSLLLTQMIYFMRLYQEQWYDNKLSIQKH